MYFMLGFVNEISTSFFYFYVAPCKIRDILLRTLLNYLRRKSDGAFFLPGPADSSILIT